MSIRRKPQQLPLESNATTPSAGGDVYRTATGFAITPSGALGFASDVEKGTMDASAAAAPVPVMQNISRPNGSGGAGKTLGRSMVSSNREAWKRMDITCESMVDNGSMQLPSKSLGRSAPSFPSMSAPNRFRTLSHEHGGSDDDDEDHADELDEHLGSLVQSDIDELVHHAVHSNIAAEMHGFFDHPGVVDLGMRYNTSEPCTRAIVRSKKPEGVAENEWKMLTKWATLMQLDAYTADVYLSEKMKESKEDMSARQAVAKALKHSPFAAYHQIFEDPKCASMKNSEFVMLMDKMIQLLAESHAMAKYPSKFAKLMARKMKRIDKRKNAKPEPKPVDKLEQWANERGINEQYMTKMAAFKKSLADHYGKVLDALKFLRDQHSGIIRDQPYGENDAFYASTPYQIVPMSRVEINSSHEASLKAAQATAKKFFKRRKLDVLSPNETYMDTISVSELRHVYTEEEMEKIRAAIQAFSGFYEKQPVLKKRGKKNKGANQQQQSGGGGVQYVFNGPTTFHSAGGASNAPQQQNNTKKRGGKKKREEKPKHRIPGHEYANEGKKHPDAAPGGGGNAGLPDTPSGAMESRVFL